MFRFEISWKHDKAHISFHGDLDIDATEIIEADVASVLKGSIRSEIDFSNVSFVDSSGIGLLISLIRNIHERGREVKICNVPSEVMQVFSLLQLPDIVGREVFAD